jgi:tRNA (guanine-N7-)-methyltransferase
MSRPFSSLLHAHLIPWTKLDWPIEWEEIFGRSSPLEVEIGFGNGGFLVEQAMRRTDHDFVGIERSLASAHRVFKWIEREGLTNVRILLGDAEFALDHLFPPEHLDRIYINFSDPWPKERHHSRRLVQAPFLELTGRRLVEDGTITIVTDHAGYAEWIEGAYTHQTMLQSLHDSVSVERIEGRTPTKYERKAIDACVPIHYYEWKRCAPVKEMVRDERIDAVPNVILDGPFDSNQLLDAFGDSTWQGNHEGVSVVVKLGHGFQDRELGHVLVEAMVREGEFAQHLAIAVIHRPPSEILVKPSPIGHPRPTWGVKQAVHRVTLALCVACPGLRVVSSTLGDTPDHETAEAD